MAARWVRRPESPSRPAARGGRAAGTAGDARPAAEMGITTVRPTHRAEAVVSSSSGEGSPRRSQDIVGRRSGKGTNCVAHGRVGTVVATAVAFGARTRTFTGSA